MRVSSDSDQTTDLQRDALLSAGVGSRHLTKLAAGDTSVGSTPIWQYVRRHHMITGNHLTETELVDALRVSQSPRPLTCTALA